MLAALARMLRGGLGLMSLRSLGLVSTLRRCARARVRAMQYTVLAGVSATLSLLAGLGALLLWIDPGLRPMLLAAVAVLLALVGIGLLHHARSLRQSTERLFSESALAVLTDLSILRRMMRSGRACAQGASAQTSAGARAEADHHKPSRPS